MIFKVIDKFFKEIKQILSVLSLVLLSISVFMFIYWLFYVIKLDMPICLNSIVSWIIDFFAQPIKHTSDYERLVDILPVLCSILFAFFTYLVNCTIFLLENSHKKYHKYVDNCRLKLEKTINNELHKDFLSELKKNSFMMVKIAISVKNKESYLSTSDDFVDEKSIKNEIEQCILATMKQNTAFTKGKTENGVYFLVSDFLYSKTFFEELVSKAAKVINSYMTPKLEVNFYCCAEVFDEINQLENISKYLDMINSIKISNRIVVTPRYKVCFENLYSTLYEFKLLGEYNINENNIIQKNIMLYSLKSK